MIEDVDREELRQGQGTHPFTHRPRSPPSGPSSCKSTVARQLPSRCGEASMHDGRARFQAASCLKLRCSSKRATVRISWSGVV